MKDIKNVNRWWKVIKYNFKTYWKCNENAIIECLFHMFPLKL